MNVPAVSHGKDLSQYVRMSHKIEGNIERINEKYGAPEVFISP